MKVFKVEVSEDLHYIVDGVQSPRIYLRVGETCRFDVNAKDYPLYITTDALGGTQFQRGSVISGSPVETGHLDFTPKSEDVGRKLFYQCDSKTNMGYKIHVVPK